MNLGKVMKSNQAPFAVREGERDPQPGQLGDVPATCADLAHAKALLQYEPKVQFKDGLRRFVEWHPQHGTL